MSCCSELQMANIVFSYSGVTKLHNVSTLRGLLQAIQQWTHSLESTLGLFCVAWSVLCIQKDYLIAESGHSCSLTRVGLIHLCNHLLELQVGLSLAQFLHHSLQLHYVYKIQPNMVILRSSQWVLSQSNGSSSHTNWLNMELYKVYSPMSPELFSSNSMNCSARKREAWVEDYYTYITWLCAASQCK